MDFRTIKLALTVLSLIGAAAPAQGQNQPPQFLSVSAGRTQGFFTKEEVFQNASLLKSDKPSNKAILFFRGWSGIANINAAYDGYRNLGFISSQVNLFFDSGISIVVVDCPTDERAMRDRSNPTACDDGYRSSQKHAQDVDKIITLLKTDHGLNEFYLFGHSYGTISSKWLAVNLGSAIAGSIHSAAQTIAGGGDYTNFAYSAMRVDFKSIKTPILHIHHQNDRCRFTPYSIVKGYSGGNLVTVRGGLEGSDPCGLSGYHSYLGRQPEASSAIIKWILTREITEFAGDE